MDNAGGSITSLGAAGLRIAHQLLDGEPKLLIDPVILRLLEPAQIDNIKNNAYRFQEPHLLGLRSSIVLRSRYTEDKLVEAYKKGIRQYLLLGAGMDTFAFRQPPGMEGLRIFEVDHPATQELKRHRLEQAGIERPSNLFFIPVDFERDDLASVLRGNSDYDYTQPCFISWLGVTVYLTMDAIDAVFRWVVSLPTGTEIVFTFAQKTIMGGLRDVALAAAEAGEPWRTFMRPEEVAWKLGKLGFSSLNFLQPEEAAAIYYQGRTDGLPSPSRASIGHAIV